MRLLLLLLFVCGFATGASASPYIVYSGEVSSSIVSASGAANSTTKLYLITDLADSSNLVLMQIDAANKTYAISNPDYAATSTIFFGDAGGGILSPVTPSTCALRFKVEGYDTNNRTHITSIYATGPIVTKPATLVPARPATVVNLKTNGVGVGSYTFAATPIINLGETLPTTLTGVYSSHQVALDGSLARASTPAPLTLNEDANLTLLANIGGAFTLGKNTAAVMPVSVPNGESETHVFAAWLNTYAQLNGYSQLLANYSTSAGAEFGIADPHFDATSLSKGASFSNEPVSLSFANGTFRYSASLVAGGSVYQPSSGEYTDILAIGGNLPPITISGQLNDNISQTDPNLFSGATLVVSPGAQVFSVLGPIYQLLNFPALVFIYNEGAPYNLSSVSLTITAVNNGLVAGTVTDSGGSVLDLVGATVTLNGVAGSPLLQPGTVIYGTAVMQGGTLSFNLVNGGLTPAATGATFSLTANLQ